VNQIAIFARQHQTSDQFLRRGIEWFDRLYQPTKSRVMAVSIHPYIAGVPRPSRSLEELLDLVAVVRPLFSGGGKAVDCSLAR
jgi:allantoinase